MPRQAPTPDQLFDRPWRPGWRCAARGGRIRRWAMLLLLLLLCGIISGYGYLTDASRVRAMAESYLSGLVGSPVKVGGATLSIFEGLRLDDVRVYVDDQTTAPDSLLFSAQTFLIKYDPRTMLTGRLEATQIVAQKPQVHLSDNRDVAEWNYERLARRRRHAPPAPPGPPGRAMVLPEIKLRNARVSISEVRGGQEVTRGLLAVDGQLTPSADGDRFAFHLQSRGVSEGIGPYASGTVSLSTGQIVAQLMNFEFDRDVRSMLPAEPRDWWQRHELAGAVSMPEISFAPGRSGAREQFKIVTVLNGVTLSVSPEEWMGRSEVTRLHSMRQSAAAMGMLYRYAGGMREGAKGRRGEGETKARSPLPPFTPSPLHPPTPADRITDLLTLSKITLKNVAGTFVFTNGGIEVKDVSGFVESNGLKINGRIDGYRPEAPIALNIASFDTENLTIPAAPRYINSLPPEVREIYEQFKPEGECRIGIRIDRTEAGARPVVGGWVQILDGRFNFNRFAYPLRNVSGRIEFGRDADGMDRLALNVRGNGIATGPNRDTVLEIKSFGDEIGPIGTNICGVNVRITGKNVTMEDALHDAFAPEVQQALANFDAHRTGKYPQFRGDFVTEVVRPVGRNRHWTFDTDIALRDATGALVAFPYPLHDLAGTLRIRSGYAEVIDLAMKRGDATLRANGRVAWTTPDGPRGPQPPYHAKDAQLSPRVDEVVKTELKIAVDNLPIDNELLAAIPKERQEWVRKLGATGKLDVEGRIFPAESAPAGADVEWVVGGKPGDVGPLATARDGVPDVPLPSPVPSTMGYDLKLTVRDGTLRPFGGAFDASALGASLRLTPTQLAIERVSAKRNGAEIAALGNIDWPDGKPRIVMNGSAKGLALDDPLYQLLPEPARHGWDETQPQGTLDVDVHYDSAAFEAAAARAKSLVTQPVSPADAAADAVDEPSGLRVVLKPRKLAATLNAMPYRLENLAGVVTVDGGKVLLENVSGAHADGTIKVSGTGILGAKPVWDLRLTGDKLPVDDELKRALPPTLAGLIDGLKLTGTVGFDFTRFVYRSAEESTAEKLAKAMQPPALGAAPVANPEIDIFGTLNLAGGSLDVGVPMTEVGGMVKIDAAVRDGHLETLRGGIDFESLRMAGRVAKNFRSDLFKPAGRSELHLSKMRSEVAGGAMSGQMTLVYPDDGPSRYSLELVVRDADVRALAWEKDDTTVNGRLTASLSLEGSWGDAAQRRGRGDVIVVGRDMYRIPLVLGLLQVTNLALPISTPFNEATAVYSLDGSRVMFESIKLKASNMLMEGDGSLDFNSKRVALTFTTDNPNTLNVPFLKDLWRGARNEMLKINVRGTIQEPEVSTQTMGTFWTTVDEVFNGKEKPEPPEKKPKKN